MPAVREHSGAQRRASRRASQHDRAGPAARRGLCSPAPGSAGRAARRGPDPRQRTCLERPARNCSPLARSPPTPPAPRSSMPRSATTRRRGRPAAGRSGRRCSPRYPDLKLANTSIARWRDVSPHSAGAVERGLDHEADSPAWRASPRRSRVRSRSARTRGSTAPAPRAGRRCRTKRAKSITISPRRRRRRSRRRRPKPPPPPNPPRPEYRRPSRRSTAAPPRPRRSPSMIRTTRYAAKAPTDAPVHHQPMSPRAAGRRERRRAAGCARAGHRQHRGPKERDSQRIAEAAARPAARGRARRRQRLALDRLMIASTPASMPPGKSPARKRGRDRLRDDAFASRREGFPRARTHLDAHLACCLATSRITPSSTPARPSFHASATRIANCSIVSGASWERSAPRLPPFARSNAAAGPRARRWSRSSVPVWSVTRAVSAGTATCARRAPATQQRARSQRARAFTPDAGRGRPARTSFRRSRPWAASRSPSRPRP